MCDFSLSGCHLLESEISKKEMTWLMPSFILIGSVAEGTRLEKADEIDLTVKFQGLDEHPLVPSTSDLDLLEFGRAQCRRAVLW